jgi:signal transduction histidine kinase
VQARTSELDAARQRAEQALAELQSAQRQLLESEKMASLGQLVAGVAHEINTPIGVAVTAASHLESSGRKLALKVAEGRVSSGELDAWRHEVVEGTGLILGSLGRACALIGSFKQVAVDQSSEQRRRVDLHACLEEIAIALGPTLRRGGHRLSIACPDGLELDTYPGALFQILGNCVTNSVLHGFPEGRAGEIVVRVRVCAGNEIELVYADDGIGMPGDVAAHAFEPFFTTRRGSGGTGLGLHIVYSLVTRLLGGSVDLRSAPGEGMTLRMRLPRVAPRRQESPVQALRTGR